MEITITSIGDKGNLESERIGLKALKECELKFYQLFKTKFGDDGFTNRSNAVYWFAPLKVKAGDIIVVYTKKGNTNKEIKADGTTIYWLYWGLDEPIFKDTKEGVVLVEIVNWKISDGI